MSCNDQFRDIIRSGRLRSPDLIARKVPGSPLGSGPIDPFYRGRRPSDRPFTNPQELNAAEARRLEQQQMRSRELNVRERDLRTMELVLKLQLATLLLSPENPDRKKN